MTGVVHASVLPGCRITKCACAAARSFRISQTYASTAAPPGGRSVGRGLRDWPAERRACYMAKRSRPQPEPGPNAWAASRRPGRRHLLELLPRFDAWRPEQRPQGTWAATTRCCCTSKENEQSSPFDHITKCACAAARSFRISQTYASTAAPPGGRSVGQGPARLACRTTRLLYGETLSASTGTGAKCLGRLTETGAPAPVGTSAAL